MLFSAAWHGTITSKRDVRKLSKGGNDAAAARESHMVCHRSKRTSLRRMLLLLLQRQQAEQVHTVHYL